MEGFGLSTGKWIIIFFLEYDNESQGSYDENFATKEEALEKAKELGYTIEIPKETD
jgi:hypothetical protein